MRMLGRAATAVALTAVVAAPVSAQFWRADLGINAGGSWYSTMVSSEDAGVTGADADVAFQPNWLAGSQLTFWFTPRFGLRANGTYTDTGLEVGDTQESEHINLWSGTGDILYRFKEPNEEWLGTEFLPYIALGLGAKWVNPAGDAFACTDQVEVETWACFPYTIPAGDDPFDQTATNVFALGERTVLAGLVGLGGDLRFHPHWSLRLEISDRIYKPHNQRAVFAGVGGNVFDLPDGAENVSKTMHEIAGQVGIHYLFGLRPPEAVAVVPAPPPVQPLPPPPPPPAPPPPPREEDIMVCVVDPSAPGALRIQSAKFLVASGDTVVEQAGQRIPIAQAVGTVPVAQGQDWYVRGTPFILTGGRYRAEYVTYGQATMRSPESLTFLGTVNGMPVFADTDEAAALRAQLEALPNRDLTVVVRDNRALRDGIDDIRTIYVPVRAVGCNFQPLLRQEPVRKGGKDAGM